jgi:hypothetical protein
MEIKFIGGSFFIGQKNLTYSVTIKLGFKNTAQGRKLKRGPQHH